MKQDDSLLELHRKVIAGLADCDRQNVERWAYIYTLASDGVKRSDGMDSSQKEVLEAICSHALKQAMRILGVAYSEGWSATSQRKTLERVRRVMGALVVFAGANPAHWQFDENESGLANSPEGCGRKTYESVWLENSGITI